MDKLGRVLLRGHAPPPWPTSVSATDQRYYMLPSRQEAALRIALRRSVCLSRHRCNSRIESLEKLKFGVGS